MMCNRTDVVSMSLSQAPFVESNMRVLMRGLLAGHPRWLGDRVLFRENSQVRSADALLQNGRAVVVLPSLVESNGLPRHDRLRAGRIGLCKRLTDILWIG